MGPLLLLMKLSFCILLLLCASVLLAQHAPSIEWQQCYGGSRNENQEVKPHTVIQSNSGFVFVACTNSNDGDVSGYHEGSDGDIWLVETGENGEILWQRALGGTLTDAPFSFVQTDHSYTIAGFSTSTDGDVSINDGGFENAWVVCVDSLQNVVWDRPIGGSQGDNLQSIIQTNDNGYIAAGYTWSGDEHWMGQSWQENHGQTDAFILKLDSLGKVVWKKLYGGSEGDVATSILQTSDGGYIFTGYSSSADGDVAAVLRLQPSIDIWVVRLDSIGNILWNKCYGGIGHERAASIIATPDGGYVIAGQSDMADGDITQHFGTGRNEDIWIIKIDSLGSLDWQQCYGGSNRDVVSSIVQSSDGNFTFVGTTNSIDGDVTDLHGGNPDSSDIWVGELSPTGSLLWQKCLGGNNADIGQAIIRTHDNGYAVYATTYSNDGDVSGNHGGSDAWLVKLSAASRVEAGSVSQFANPFPNPSSAKVSLALFRSAQVDKIQFYNQVGIECFTEYRIEGDVLTADIHSLPVGLYIIRITFTDRSIGQQVRKFLRVR